VQRGRLGSGTWQEPIERTVDQGLIMALLGCGMLAAGGGAHAAVAREAQWREVDEAVAKRLPQTVVEKLGPIIDAALREEAWGEAVKAIGRRIHWEGARQGGRPETRITLMQQELDRAPAAIVPVLETVQANWHWQYFQQNRWRFMQRTAVAEGAGEDFTTWDLPRLFGEIDRRFQQALAAEPQLKQIPIAQYGDLLEPGNLPDPYRPTLYDFLAYQALAFYNAGEQAAAKPEEAFELKAEGPIFDAVDRFTQWDIAAEAGPANADSPRVRAVALYQALLRFHGRDEEPTALADADLARLVFGWNQAVGEEKKARYLAALGAFAGRWADHEISALALHHAALVHQADGQLPQAHALASRGWQTHPESPGGRRCHNLIQELEAPSLSLSTERVWNEPWPGIRVQYRNLTNLHFRIVAWDWNDFLQRHRSRPDQLRLEDERRELLAREPVYSWSAPLPATADYRDRTELIEVTSRLAPGHYFLVASAEPGFGADENQVSFVDFWVSDLALVLRSHERNLEGFVLDARDGESPGRCGGHGLAFGPTGESGTELAGGSHRHQRILSHPEPPGVAESGAGAPSLRLRVARVGIFA
jgi:hypothetical protein